MNERGGKRAGMFMVPVVSLFASQARAVDARLLARTEANDLYSHTAYGIPAMHERTHARTWGTLTQ